MREELEKSLQKDLKRFINIHSLERYFGNVPDFILAKFTLSAWNALRDAIYERDSWFTDCYKDDKETTDDTSN